MSDSKFLDFCSKVSRKVVSIMSSVAVMTASQHARELGKILAPDLPGKVQMDRLYRALRQHYPEVQSFTRRRVRAFFFGEAHRVDFEEVSALAELKALEEARREHRKFVADTTRLAAALAAGGAALTREQMEILEELASRSPEVQGGSASISVHHHAVSGRTVRGMAGSGVAGGGR